MRRTLLAAAAAIVCGAAQASAAVMARPAGIGGVAQVASWSNLSQAADPRPALGTLMAAAVDAGALGGLTFLAMTHESVAARVFVQQGAHYGALAPAAAGQALVNHDNSSGVPEPEAYALLTAGLGAIALLMRRRRFD